MLVKAPMWNPQRQSKPCKILAHFCQNAGFRVQRTLYVGIVKNTKKQVLNIPANAMLKRL